MMGMGKHILTKFMNRWKLFLGLETICYAFGAAIFIYFLSLNLMYALIAFLGISIVSAFLIKPWQPNLHRTSQYIDHHLQSAEYSTSLFLKPYDRLSDLAKLQQNKIANNIKDELKRIQPPHNFYRSLLITIGFMALGFIAYFFNWSQYFETPNMTPVNQDIVTFQPLDSLDSKSVSPYIVEQSVTINYPNYTGLKTRHSSTMDINAVEGSRVSWHLKFNSDVKEVMMESMGNVYPLKLLKDGYFGSTVLQSSGFYNFKFNDTLGQSYSSIYYAIEVVKDDAPEVEISEIDQFTSFDFDETKTINFRSEITDDYGIDQAYIIATVSKGSGESVKFREEKIDFDTTFPKGNTTAILMKQIDLDHMQMEPGDELYFYVEATDLKQPKPNKARSETYFAAIKDTISYVFGVEGTLGVDRMPDYFRSQRQLIIDTEKLLAEKADLEDAEFKFKSNELGYDQKALRLKYAEFMGEETEEGLVIEEDIEALEADDHDEENLEETDPLAEYTHDHDGDNEHNLVEDPNLTEDSKNPLQEFIHDHEDPESATLFEESLKTKLLKALNEMWDAELYLRLYKPEQSLPYQYRALKHIQDIKNSARIYVHRIGFDPPPIKEDKRLTGKIEDVKGYRKNADLAEKESNLYIRQSIARLEQFIIEGLELNDKDKKLFEFAGNELAVIAIENPGRHLKTLQQLKSLTTVIEISLELLGDVQNGLHQALPENKPSPHQSEVLLDELNQLLLKELENYD
ncbi:MAG: tryptophan-rich sensory protein [Bacteroidia bacterium]|nr:tryptophan-rich sensory protein [Bacteroidia bacterium]NNK59070.1 tryptophan-rich sensory protein [Flavobacteriaceae bacterium]